MRIPAFICLLGCLSCGQTNGSNLQGSAPIEYTGETLTDDEVVDLKKQIRAICLPNIERQDNLEQVRAQLDPLVQRLAAHFGQKQANEKLQLVRGAWREIWTDQPYPMSFVTSMDYKQIYQVVSDRGYYWNLSDSKLFGFIPTTGGLRGKFVARETKIVLEFTRVGFRFWGIQKGIDLVGLAESIEQGKLKLIGIPGGGRAPNGPVGIQGSLETVYVDDDLRIDLGNQTDFKDKDGKVLVPGVQNRLFILDRAVIPVR